MPDELKSNEIKRNHRMGGKIAKSLLNKNDSKGQRVFLCDECFQNRYNASETCKICNKIDLDVCFYPFSDPYLTLDMNQKQIIFKDSLESLFGNVGCCGVKCNNEEKININQPHELAPQITREDLLTPDLTKSALGLPYNAHSLSWKSYMSGDGKNYCKKSEALSVEILDPFPISDKNFGINYSRNDIATSTSAIDLLPKMAIQVQVGEGSSQEINNDSITIHIEPDDLDCFNSWENSDFMNNFPSESKLLPSSPTIDINEQSAGNKQNKMKTENNSNCSDYCIETIVGKSVYITLPTSKSVVNNKPTKSVKIQSNLEDLKMNNPIKNSMANNIISPDVQKQIPVENELNLSKLKLEKQNDICKSLLSSLPNEDLFNKISLFNINKFSLKDDSKVNELNVNTNSFENILNSFYCNASSNNNNYNNNKLIDCKTYDVGLERQEKRKLGKMVSRAVSPLTWKNKITKEETESIRFKPKSPSYIDKMKINCSEDDLTLNENIPLQLQGVFPEKGTASFATSICPLNKKLNESFKNKNYLKTNALTISKSDFSIFSKKKTKKINNVQKVLKLFENIVDELLPFASFEIMQEYKKLGNPHHLGVLMVITKDLNVAKSIIKFMKSMTHRLVDDNNILNKIIDILARVEKSFLKLNIGWPNFNGQCPSLNPQTVYDFHMTIFESLKPSLDSTTSLPVARSKSLPMLTISPSMQIK